MKISRIFKIIIYLLILMLGIIAFVNLTSLSVQEALITTVLIEIFTIIADLIFLKILRNKWTKLKFSYFRVFEIEITPEQLAAYENGFLDIALSELETEELYNALDE